MGLSTLKLQLSLGHPRHEIITCGEANSETDALRIAIAELVERTAMFKHHRFNPSSAQTSNGWAAHTDFELARKNAILELIERDAVLSNWYLAKPFLEVDPFTIPSIFNDWQKSELSRSELPVLRILLSTDGIGPSVTCLLQNKNGFGIASHATKLTLKSSIESAVAEACRASHAYLRKMFWHETKSLSSGRGNETNASDGVNALSYAYHEPFPSWMYGRKISWEPAELLWSERLEQLKNSEMKNFTFQLVASDPLYVGFATHPRTFEFYMGKSNETQILGNLAARRIQLTKENINLKPHIIG